MKSHKCNEWGGGVNNNLRDNLMWLMTPRCKVLPFLNWDQVWAVLPYAVVWLSAVSWEHWEEWEDLHRSGPRWPDLHWRQGGAHGCLLATQKYINQVTVFHNKYTLWMKQIFFLQNVSSIKSTISVNWFSSSDHRYILRRICLKKDNFENLNSCTYNVRKRNWKFLLTVILCFVTVVWQSGWLSFFKNKYIYGKAQCFFLNPLDDVGWGPHCKMVFMLGATHWQLVVVHICMTYT